jgi:hypothetical protein
MSGLGLTFLRRGGQAHPTAGSDYIKFKDEEVLRVLMANGVSSDGVGITVDDAAKVTSIGSWFKGNTLIASFDEFIYFTGVTRLGAEELNDNNAAFKGCTSLKSITLPESCKNIGYRVFHGCTALKNINLENAERLWLEAFFKCAALDIDIVAPSLKYVGMTTFSNSGIRRALDLGVVTSLPGGWGNDEGTFRKCTSMDVAILPPTLTSLGVFCIADCTKLSALIFKSNTPPTFSSGALTSTNNCPIYVPDAVVDNYKTANTWSSLSGRIMGISSLSANYPSLYAEIKDYL